MKHHIGDQAEKCIIGFDIWGTLLDLDKVLEYIGLTLAERTGMDKERSVKLVFKVHDEARKIRRLNPDLPVRDLIKLSGRLIEDNFNTPISTVEDAIRRAFETIGNEVVYDDVMPALESLRERGIRMGVVGNVLFWRSMYTRSILDRLGLSQFFSEMVYSDELDISKPDRKIFLELTRRMKIEPNRLIYVGDNIIEDVGGPLSAGGYGVLLRRDTSSLIVLRELRVAMINRLTYLPGIYDLLCE